MNMLSVQNGRLKLLTNNADLDEQKKQIHEVRQIIHQTTQSVHKQISGVYTEHYIF